MEEKQLEAIGKMLDTALEYGLELEVIYFALTTMKKNPELSPAEAFALGVTEWVK
jgi:hypothetical protein